MQKMNYAAQMSDRVDGVSKTNETEAGNGYGLKIYTKKEAEQDIGT